MPTSAAVTVFVIDQPSSGDVRTYHLALTRQALVSLLNGREFPVSMQDMKPLIAKSGGKTLFIAMKFVDIQARRDVLQFSLLPQVSSK